MTQSSRAISPLRQRMIDDMRMRKLESKTRAAYLRAVEKLAVFLKRSLDTATVEDLRRFQLYPVDQGISLVTINATIVGLKFFFDPTPTLRVSVTRRPVQRDGQVSDKPKLNRSFPRTRGIAAATAPG